MNADSEGFFIREILATKDLDQNFLEILLENLADSDHMRFSRHSEKSHTLETTLAFIEDLLSNRGRYFQVIKNDQISYLGTFTLAPKLDGKCEAGIMMFKGANNNGYGLSVWSLIPELMRTSGFTEMIAGCHKDNSAMKKIMISCGMTQVNTRDLESEDNYRNQNLYFSLKLS